MTTTLEPDVHVPDARSAAPSRTQAAPSPTFADASDDIDKTSRQASTALMWTCLVLAPFIAFVGFYLSFHNLTAAAHDRFGFPTIGQARLFALGVDGAIVLFLAGDLFFVSRGRHAYPVLRPAAHLMTVGTIWFNATAMGPITEHWDKAIPHAFMPVLFVVTIEAGRHYLIQAAELEMGLGRQSAPFARWILAPRVTFAMWSRMKQWGYTYEEVMDLEQERAIYGVWLEHREELEAGHEEGMVSALDRLPITMKKFGMSVDDALALPDKMRRQAQERDQRATAAEIHLSLAAEKAAADAEAQRLQIQGEIDRVRASVAAETGIAEARAEASTAGARLEATSAVAAAKRAAEAADRQAEIEAAAEQSAKVAEESAKEQAALAKAAQESAKIAEAKRQEAEAKRITAEESAKEQAALAKVAEESAKIARAEQQTAEAQAKAADARERNARANLAAVEAEDLAGLSQRPRKIRRAARLLLESVPEHETAMRNGEDAADHLRDNSPLTGADIGAALGITSPGTASEYRTEALALIARGYNHRTGYDPDRTTDQEN